MTFGGLHSVHTTMLHSVHTTMHASFSARSFNKGSTTLVFFVVPPPRPTHYKLRLPSSCLGHPQCCDPCIDPFYFAVEVRTSLSSVGQPCPFPYEPSVCPGEWRTAQHLRQFLLCQAAKRRRRMNVVPASDTVLKSTQATQAVT